MQYNPPQPISLTDEERKLWDTVNKAPTHDDWHEIADAMENLTRALIERRAIPEVRLQLFNDSDYAEKGNKSRAQVFESNGTSGNDILRHPHFIPYLRHFIEGPDLPKEAIDGLCKILNDDAGTSGMLMNQYQRFARATVRKFQISPRHAATEFFRLGVEIGMGIHDARTLRDAALSAR